MKKLSMLITAVLTVIVSICAVSQAEAIVVIGGKFGMVGITRGQTARLNVVNVGAPDEGKWMVELMFFDGEGNMLAEMGIIIDGGKAAIHDLNGDDIVEREVGRLQIRAEVMVMGDKKSCDVIPTLEIYDNETMKTEVFEMITLDPY